MYKTLKKLKLIHSKFRGMKKIYFEIKGTKIIQKIHRD